MSDVPTEYIVLVETDDGTTAKIATTWDDVVAFLGNYDDGAIHRAVTYPLEVVG